MPVGQRTMARGVGVNLGAIECDGAQFEQLHLPGDAQHLHKKRLDLFEKALAKGADSVAENVENQSETSDSDGKASRAMRRASPEIVVRRSISLKPALA